MPSQFAREIAQDSRHALRLWRRRPLSTGFAIAALAIAIGANTGVFSVLNALLLRSLPFHEPDRLASLHAFAPPPGLQGRGVSRMATAEHVPGRCRVVPARWK